MSFSHCINIWWPVSEPIIFPFHHLYLILVFWSAHTRQGWSGIQVLLIQRANLTQRSALCDLCTTSFHVKGQWERLQEERKRGQGKKNHCELNTVSKHCSSLTRCCYGLTCFSMLPLSLSGTAGYKVWCKYFRGCVTVTEILQFCKPLVNF